jgi:hypothetical protein
MTKRHLKCTALAARLGNADLHERWDGGDKSREKDICQNGDREYLYVPRAFLDTANTKFLGRITLDYYVFFLRLVSTSKNSRIY